MRARAGSLAPDEIAVRCRSAALAGAHHVAVDAEAHRTAGGGPLQSGRQEDTIETFGFRLCFDQTGSWDHPGFDTCGSGAPIDYRSRCAQIFDAAVRARTDEDAINSD